MTVVENMSTDRVTESIVLVGNSGGTNVGESLYRAGQEQNRRIEFMDTAFASKSWRIVRSMFWKWDHRPVRLNQFSEMVDERCRETGARLLLVAGLGPVTAKTLANIGKRNTIRAVILTDDPWNTNHRSRWFLSALNLYDVIFTPRRSIFEDLKQAGCRRIEYLPFGYDPTFFYPDLEQEYDDSNADLLFVGGGDADRGTILSEIVAAGLKPKIFGSNWQGFPDLKPYLQGQIGPEQLRRETTSDSMSLILVRRANRDGHVMRTFEAAACRGCLLVEETDEHREIFGRDGECVVYFSNVPQLIERAKSLRSNPKERSRLAAAVYEHIVIRGRHTYGHRLNAILASVWESTS